MPLSLQEELRPKICASMAGLWVQTWEIEEAEAEILALCQDQESPWAMASWDITKKLHDYSTTEEKSRIQTAEFGAALQYLREKLGRRTATRTTSQRSAEPEELSPALLLLKNGHFIMQGPGNLQLLADAVWHGKKIFRFVVVLSHSSYIPPELEKLFTLVEHPLPHREQLQRIADQLVNSPEELGDTPEAVTAVMDAAAGMTRVEAENAFALSITENGKIEPDALFTLKAQMLRKGNQSLKLHRGRETFDDIGGLQHLKTFCSTMLQRRETVPKYRPRGVLVMGVTGSGKTLFTKALGNAVGRPTLICDLGATRGSLQGQTEAWTREMLQKADAMAPAILMLDEVEKALAGVGGSGKTDAGVTARQMGTLLTWLNDHDSDVYVVATCNNILAITEDNPEFIRAGRFDGLFFSDFPILEVRNQIWDIHLAAYEHTPGCMLPDDEYWTGAEIEACCRLARLQGKTVAEFGASMPKVAEQAADSIDRARRWADKRCWSTEEAKLYDMTDTLKHLTQRDERRQLVRATGSASKSSRAPRRGSPSDN